MHAPNPYAPPQGAVRDVAAPDQHVEPAERVSRLVAVILDSLIVFAMCYLPFILVAMVAGGAAQAVSEEPNAALLGLGVVLSLVGVVAWISITVRNVIANGQSIAKKMLGIKVVRSDGSPVSLSRIFWLRNVVNILLGLVPFYGLIDALLIFGADRQCIHDKIADTVVVKA